MQYSFDGWRSQFTDPYRILFPLILASILIIVGSYINSDTGEGLMIGGFIGLAINVRDSLTYKLVLSNKRILLAYEECLRKLGFNEIDDATYKLKSWLPQYDSQKVKVEMKSDCIIIRSTRFNIRRIMKRLT